MNFSLELAANLPTILVDEKEIRQLIFNLVPNGFEAMEPGHNLVIKAAAEENHVILASEAQGIGIEPKILEDLGKPFLTTKEKGLL
ncbi:ATP-binding protein [Bacillota bacterium LX-D]|nr:ATP-binding protein [Bacillota bacterium LX-D]